MKKTGIVLMALCLLSVLLVLFRVDDHAVYEIEFFNESRTIVYLSGILFLAGSLFLRFGLPVSLKQIPPNPPSKRGESKSVCGLVGMVLAFFVRWIQSTARIMCGEEI